MRRVLAVCVLALVLPSPAAAKELLEVEFCGPAACRTVTDPATLRGLPTGGETEEPLGAPAPYYRLTLVLGEADFRHESTLYYVPSRDALVSQAENGRMQQLPIFGGGAQRVMHELVEGLAAYSRPAIESVAVGRRIVRGRAAQSYLALFALSATARIDYPSDWVAVDFRSKVRSPWTDASRELMYSPRRNALERGWRLVAVPSRAAANFEAGRPLDAGQGSRGLPVALAVGLVPFAALLGLAALRGKKHRDDAV